MIKSVDQEQRKILLKRGIIEHMGRIIKGELDERIQEIVLKGILDLLDLGVSGISGGYSQEKRWLIFEKNDVMEVIEGLRSSDNSQVAELAGKIISNEKYGC